MVKRSAVAAGSMLTLAFASPAFAYDFSDTEISYSYGWAYKEPGTPTNIPQNNLYLTHVDGYSLGTNFVGIDVTKWGQGNDANCVLCAPGTQEAGATELYSVWRTTLSGNKITKSSMFSWGPIKDVSFEMGFDLETEDATFAAEKRLLVAGPQFAIAIPKGFWNISLHISKEWNNDAFAANGQTNFDPAPELETQWLYPMQIGPVPINFTGFLNIVGPKGVGATGVGQTRTEFLAHPKLMVDVGALAFSIPGKFEAGIGFEYWLNKFGDTTDMPGVVGGTHQRALFFETGYHF